MSRTKTNIDHATFTITFHRSFAAGREDVFDAWTRPEQIAAWWDPRGTKLLQSEIDLREGGTFGLVNDGHSPPFTGVYRLVERPGKLVFVANGALTDIDRTFDKLVANVAKKAA